MAASQVRQSVRREPYAFLLVLCMLPVATCALVVSAFVPRLRQRPWLVYSFLIAHAVIGVVLLFDPYSFFLWFMD